MDFEIIAIIVGTIFVFLVWTDTKKEKGREFLIEHIIGAFSATYAIIVGAYIIATIIFPWLQNYLSFPISPTYYVLLSLILFYYGGNFIYQNYSPFKNFIDKRYPERAKKNEQPCTQEQIEQYLSDYMQKSKTKASNSGNPKPKTPTSKRHGGKDIRNLISVYLSKTSEMPALMLGLAWAWLAALAGAARSHALGGQRPPLASASNSLIPQALLLNARPLSSWGSGQEIRSG